MGVITESAFTTTLAQTLKASGSDATIKLGALPLTITAGKMKIGTGANSEWVNFTGVDAPTTSLTGCTRGIKKNATSATDALAANKKNHVVGTVVKLVFHSVDINDKASQNGNNTFSGNNAFSGVNSYTNENNFSGKFKIPTFVNAAARDAAIPAPVNGQEAVVAGDLQHYNGVTVQWEIADTGTPTPNASDTVAGKGQNATQAKTNAGDDTGSTTAPNFLLPSRTAKAIQDSKWTYAVDSVGSDSYAVTITPALTEYVDGQITSFEAGTANTGACTLNENSLGARHIKKGDYVALATGDIPKGGKVIVQMNIKAVTFNAVFAGGETSGTLASNWLYATGIYTVIFSNSDTREVTLTNGNTTATWTGGLSSAATISANTQYFSMQSQASQTYATETYVNTQITDNTTPAFGSDTWSVSADAQTKTITHNLGRVPKLIRITYGVTSTITDASTCSGVYLVDGGLLAHKSINNYTNANPGNTWTHNAGNGVVLVDRNPTGGPDWTATVTSCDTTQFVLTSANYSSTQAIAFTWECL